MITPEHRRILIIGAIIVALILIGNLGGLYWMSDIDGHRTHSVRHRVHTDSPTHGRTRQHPIDRILRTSLLRIPSLDGTKLFSGGFSLVMVSVGHDPRPGDDASAKIFRGYLAVLVSLRYAN